MPVREFSEEERKAIAARALAQFRERLQDEIVTATVDKLSDEDGLPKITFHKTQPKK